MSYESEESTPIQSDTPENLCILFMIVFIIGFLVLVFTYEPNKEDNKQPLNKEVEVQCLQSNN